MVAGQADVVAMCFDGDAPTSADGASPPGAASLALGASSAYEVILATATCPTFLVGARANAAG